MTRFAMRVLPTTSQPIYARMDARGPTAPYRADAFRPLYAFERIGIAGSARRSLAGWYRVGVHTRQAIGYVRAEDMIEWRLPIMASYTRRDMEADPRDTVAYFDRLGDIEAAIGGAQPRFRPGELLRSLHAARAAGVVAREPEAPPHSADRLDVLPIMQSVDIEAFGVKDGWLLQMALPTMPGARPQRRSCLPLIGECAGGLALAPVDFLDTLAELRGPAALVWATNFDLARRDRKSLALHVLLTKSEVHDLQRALVELYSELELSRLDTWLERGSRSGLPGGGYDEPPRPDLDSDKLEELHRRDRNRLVTDLLPAWLSALPYRTELAGLTKGDLSTQNRTRQAYIEQRLNELAKQIRQALAQPEAWVTPAGHGVVDDESVIAWPLAHLP